MKRIFSSKNRGIVTTAVLIAAAFLATAGPAESNHALVPVCTLAVGCEIYQGVGRRGCARDANTNSLFHRCSTANVRATYNQTGTNSGTVRVDYGFTALDTYGEVEIYNVNGYLITEKFCFADCGGKSFTYGPYSNVGGVRAALLTSAGLVHDEAQVNIGVHNNPCLGVNCNDGNACTIDSCVGGVCQNVPRNCDDGNVCTFDSCNPSSGCQHTTNSCDDFNACTTDICDPQLGCIWWPKLCSGNQDCGTGFCDPSTGDCIPNIVCHGSSQTCFDFACEEGVCSEIPIQGGCRCIAE